MLTGLELPLKTAGTKKLLFCFLCVKLKILPIHNLTFEFLTFFLRKFSDKTLSFPYSLIGFVLSVSFNFLSE